jgi:hypothetical protein
MAMQMSWWGWCFLLYSGLLDHFAILWLAHYPAATLTQSDPKAN